ncbi:hypothetical protein CGRA01v4_14035 [Colletotrichum graminicola]|nr:hypothetical protein CGRA01v4_14035 [Colletotrichum graminicola]
MSWSMARVSLLLALVYLCAICQAREVIGYRVVSKGEAERINERHTPIRNDMYDSETGNQIGSGVHLVPYPGGWMEIPNIQDWHCVFKADQDRLRRATKVWIPPRLWWSRNSVIREYVNQYGDPDQTLRFSYIDQWQDGRVLQMVIPTKMVNDDTLDFFAICFPTLGDLTRYENQYISWPDWGLIMGS